MRRVSSVAGSRRRWLLVPGEGAPGCIGLPLMAVSSPCGRREGLGLRIADMKVGREPSSL